MSSPRTRCGRPRPAGGAGRRSARTSRARRGRRQRRSANAAAPKRRPTQRGVIYTVAPSPLDLNRICRHRRRPRPDDRRRRRDSARRDAAGSEAVHEGVDRRRRPLRRADRVRRSTRCGSTTCGRTSTARRRRQDLTAISQRHPRRRAGRRGPRGSPAEGAALRRHGAGGPSLVRRRRALAVAAAEHCPRPRSAISSSRVTI